MEKAVHAKYTPHVVILRKYEQGRGRQSTEEERALKHVSKTHTLTKSHLFKLMCSTYWKKNACKDGHQNINGGYFSVTFTFS